MANENVPGGNNTDSGGEGAKGNEGTVSRETYNKSVTAEKNLRKELNEVREKLTSFETNQQTLQEQKLLDEKKHLEVIDNQKKQIAELTGKTSSLLQDRDDTRKLNAALGLLQEKGIQVEAKYLGLISLDSINLNDDGSIDHTSVTETVNNFQKEHPRLIASQTSFPPNSKTGNSGKKMSIEEWKKLPLKEKEKAYKSGMVDNPYARKK